MASVPPSATGKQEWPASTDSGAPTHRLTCPNRIADPDAGVDERGGRLAVHAEAEDPAGQKRYDRCVSTPGQSASDETADDKDYGWDQDLLAEAQEKALYARVVGAWPPAPDPPVLPSPYRMGARPEMLRRHHLLVGITGVWGMRLTGAESFQAQDVVPGHPSSPATSGSYSSKLYTPYGCYPAT
jgi:hypothetical protein